MVHLVGLSQFVYFGVGFGPGRTAGVLSRYVTLPRSRGKTQPTFPAVVAGGSLCALKLTKQEFHMPLLELARPGKNWNPPKNALCHLANS